jgi:hypothetical protein
MSPEEFLKRGRAAQAAVNAITGKPTLPWPLMRAELCDHAALLLTAAATRTPIGPDRVHEDLVNTAKCLRWFARDLRAEETP